MVDRGELTLHVRPERIAEVCQVMRDDLALRFELCSSVSGVDYLGVDHIVPVDMYLPGCPPRPEMLIDAILKLREKIMYEPLGPNGRKMLEARKERGDVPVVPYGSTPGCRTGALTSTCPPASTTGGWPPSGPSPGERLWHAPA